MEVSLCFYAIVGTHFHISLHRTINMANILTKVRINVPFVLLGFFKHRMVLVHCMRPVKKDIKI